MRSQFLRLTTGVQNADEAQQTLSRDQDPRTFWAGQYFECTAEAFDTLVRVATKGHWTADGYTTPDFAPEGLATGFASISGRYFCIVFERGTKEAFVSTLRAFRRHLSQTGD